MHVFGLWGGCAEYLQRGEHGEHMNIPLYQPAALLKVNVTFSVHLENINLKNRAREAEKSLNLSTAITW